MMDGDAYVLEYLIQKGYKGAEAKLREETMSKSVGELALEAGASIHQVVTKQVMMYGGRDHDESYNMLKEWVHASLDIYKVSARLRFSLISTFGVDSTS